MPRPLHFLSVSIVLLLAACSQEPLKDPLLQKAESGDPAAQLAWAENALEAGDPQTALPWLEKSQENGYQPAALRLAILTAQNTFPERPAADGIEALKTLAATGDTTALVTLADHYQHTPSPQPEKAAAYYQKAADLGHPFAQYQAALNQWLTQKEEMSAEEIRQLGNRMFTLGKNKEPRALSLYARILDADDNQAAADKFHLEAAKAGEPYSQYRIGIAYHRYVRDPAYGPLGFEYLAKAEQAGVTQALMPLSKAYYQGNGTPANKETSRQIALIAAWLGDPEAIEYSIKRYMLEKSWTLSERIDLRALQFIAESMTQMELGLVNQRMGISGVMFDHFAKNRMLEMLSLAKQYKQARTTRSSQQPKLQAGLNPSDQFARYGEDRKLVETALEQADKDAMFQLAQNCLDPQSPYYEESEGIKWLFDAARNRSREANLKIYELYRENPDHNFISSEQAIISLQAANLEPSPVTSMYLAREYYTGNHVDKDNLIAIRHAEQALESGSPEAKDFIKNILLEGTDFQINSETVLSLVKEIGKDGNVDFQFLHAAHQIGNHAVLKKSILDRFLVDLTDKTRNGFWFDPITDHKQIWYCYDLTLIRDDTLPENITKAVDNIVRLADEGYTKAQETVAMWYLNGVFFEPNAEKALSYLEACRDTSESPQLFLEFANAYFTAETLPPGVVESSALFRRAAELGNPSCRELFSDMEWVAPKTIEEGYYPYSPIETAYKASVEEDAEAMYQTALYFRDYCELDEEYSKNEFNKWLAESAKRNNIDALNTIGINYMQGIDAEKNPRRGLRYLKQAADLGDPDSQYNYGFFLSTGFEIERDMAEGVKYLEMSAAQGYAKASTLLENLKTYRPKDTLESAEPEDVLNQFFAAALGHDTFPVRPHIAHQRELLPTIGVNRGRPTVEVDSKELPGKYGQGPILLAGKSFHPARVSIESAMLMAPILMIGESMVFTGREPSLTIDFECDQNVDDAYALLLIRQGPRIADPTWKRIGKLTAGKKKRIQFKYDDNYVEIMDLAVYFFAGDQEILSNIRFQPQHFLDNDLNAFASEREEYVKRNENEDKTASITKSISELVGGVIYLPAESLARFELNEYGFVRSIQLADDLREDAVAQIFRTLPFITFFPQLKNGQPSPASVQIPID